MTKITLNAEVRSDLGKGASRRLRRNDSLVPAVVYGGSAAPQSVSLLAKDFAKALENEATFSSIISLNIGGTAQDVVLKALQRHPSKSYVVHADFQRVIAGQKMTANVPLHFINAETSVGVKQQGGEVSHVVSEVEVSCEAKNLPEFIEVDLSNVEVGQILHLSDLKMPNGVELVALAHGNNLAVANIHASRAE